MVVVVISDFIGLLSLNDASFFSVLLLVRIETVVTAINAPFGVCMSLGFVRSIDCSYDLAAYEGLVTVSIIVSVKLLGPLWLIFYVWMALVISF